MEVMQSKKDLSNLIGEVMEWRRLKAKPAKELRKETPEEHLAGQATAHLNELLKYVEERPYNHLLFRLWPDMEPRERLEFQWQLMNYGWGHEPVVKPATWVADRLRPFLDQLDHDLHAGVENDA